MKLVLSTLIAVGSLVAVWVWFWQKRKRQTCRPDLAVDPAFATREFIDANEDVRALYARLGYAPRLEWKLERLMKELKELIRAEIPDFGAFQEALGAVQSRLESGNEDPLDLVGLAWDEKKGDALFRAVVEAGNDGDRVLELLNEDAVQTPLIFVEQLPFYREGKLTWRTPIGLSVVRKRPANTLHFAQLLYQVESLVRTAQIRRSLKATQAILEEIARLRQALQKDDSYFPTAIRALDRRVSEWLLNADSSNGRERREQLDQLFSELAAVREALEERQPRELEEVHKRARVLARFYLDAPWMHTTGFTDLLLLLLLDAELRRLPTFSLGGRASAPGVLRMVREEVASGDYDSEENMRRLQLQESKGVYIHSLIYGLFRLNRALLGRP